MPTDVSTSEKRKRLPTAKAVQQKASGRIAEQERQFREILEYCPAALIVVDEESRLIFHNASLRELLGYEKEEMDLIDTRRFWVVLDHRSRVVETLRERGGKLLN